MIGSGWLFGAYHASRIAGLLSIGREGEKTPPDILYRCDTRRCPRVSLPVPPVARRADKRTSVRDGGHGRVGGGTGAAMTAVAMIFEMTRDYDIVLPMIIAVAFSLGTRRLLSPESIYTLKLARRGQIIPSALHANMFLVQSARQVMETHVLVLGADVPFRDLLGSPDDPAFRHVVVTRNGKIHGVLRINTGLRRAVSRDDPSVMLGRLAQHNYIVVDASDAAFDVISQLRQRRATMAVVTSGNQSRPAHVSGVIAKEHIADAVASSIRIFPAGASNGTRRGNGMNSGSRREAAERAARKEDRHETEI